MQTEIKYWHLRNHKLFRVLSNRQIEELCLIIRYKKAGKGEVIHFTDEEARNCIFFLKRGAIKIVEIDAEGREVIREILRPGDLFGELGLDMENASEEYAQAITKEVQLCSFKQSDFEQLLSQYPDIAMGYMRIVGWRLKRLQNSYSRLFFKDVKTRLRLYLEDWASKEGKKEQDRWMIENYLTHQDLAGLVCASRQTVTEVLNEWESEGKLGWSRKEIWFTDLKH